MSEQKQPEQQPIVTPSHRHLKWPLFDRLEYVLMVFCGITLAGFVTTVFFDVVTRTSGVLFWPALQEVTNVLFIYCVFAGTAVAVRRNDHLLLTAITESMSGGTRMFFETMNRCVILVCGACMVYFGILNVLAGFGNFRMPSLTPLAYWYAAIPISGAFIVLFSIEQLVNGWRNGFIGAEEQKRRAARAGVEGATP